MSTKPNYALRFVVLVGVVSLFADFTYEGARGVAGPYLALLGASGAAVGAVSGFGELVGYALRFASGRAADRTRAYWGLTIAGYVIQMAAVPAIALTRSWPAAAVLLVFERIGKATRNPPRDAMLAHAGAEMGGYGWTFGLHEALDQTGAIAGPLLVAWLLMRDSSLSGYRTGFAALFFPAAITVVLVIVARVIYPAPENLERKGTNIESKGLDRRFWVYLAGAALVSAGFADFPLIAFHFEKADVMGASAVPLAYALSMAAGGAASLALGKVYDKVGIGVLVPLTIATAAYAPMCFLGGTTMALAGAALWGIGIGVHGSIVPAAVATMVSPDRRASAYGLFNAGYGIAWFVGSAALGLAYDASPRVAIALAVILELAAVPIFVALARKR